MFHPYFVASRRRRLFRESAAVCRPQAFAKAEFFFYRIYLAGFALAGCDLDDIRILQSRTSFPVPVKLIATKRFEDARGWFAETWSKRAAEAEGADADFVQDNHSYSRHAGTIRGLHFQAEPFAQAKLVRCTRGRIFDVAVDIRRGSPTFLKWVGAELSAENGDQLFVPRGFAHGFLTLEPDCEVVYKVDGFYNAAADGGIRWDDARLRIDWPLGKLDPILSEKDRGLPFIEEADFDFPYDGEPLLGL